MGGAGALAWSYLNLHVSRSRIAWSCRCNSRVVRSTALPAPDGTMSSTLRWGFHACAARRQLKNRTAEYEYQ